MSARLDGWLGPWLLVFVACGQEERPPQLMELPFAPPGDLGARRDKNEWALEGPSEDVRFFVGDLDREPFAARTAESVPLLDGGILAAVTLHQEWDAQTCYLELHLTPGGWHPTRVGLLFSSDMGFWWLVGLHGRVLVDSHGTDVVDCRVELVSTEGISKSFRLDFLVDPRRDSVSLRNSIPRMPGRPALR